ncbi:MAG: ZIP family metal transporter [Thermoprotei archaeon]|nr:MAG: ZIP family metal transporter [Thermoprotei archaeon]
MFLRCPVLGGFIGSLLAGLATGIGALPVFFFRKIPQKVIDALLGFSAGVMLAASFFSLIIPALDIGGLYVTLMGIILGVMMIFLANEYLPHEHLIKGIEGYHRLRIRRIWLFVFAITIHNLPEGLAVGVGFGTGNIKEAIVLAVAIGLQNAPEGLAVAFSLMATLRYTARYSFVVALLTGLVEPVAGVLGAYLTTISHMLLPYAMASAGGAMIYVVSNEIIPESHRLGHEKQASLGLIIGFLIMLILDNIF